MPAVITKLPIKARSGYGPVIHVSKHSLLRRWLHNYQSRIALAQLTPDLLDDIGMTRAQALAEASKPFFID